jgi:hypothetical protein
MSGTSYGICVQHVAPESAAGGPLALVRDGDLIELDMPGRRLDLHVSEDELAERRAAWHAPAAPPVRGYGALFAQHVTQADKGCDFDFLTGAGEPEPGDPLTLRTQARGNAQPGERRRRASLPISSRSRAGVSVVATGV